MIYPVETWKWYGHAGHFICGRWCRFHMATLVGNRRYDVKAFIKEAWGVIEVSLALGFIAVCVRVGWEIAGAIFN